jgi:hypothetical protein
LQLHSWIHLLSLRLLFSAIWFIPHAHAHT